MVQKLAQLLTAFVTLFGGREEFPDIFDAAQRFLGSLLLKHLEILRSGHDLFQQSRAGKLLRILYKPGNHLVEDFESANCPHRQPRFADCRLDGIPDQDTALDGEFFKRVGGRLADSAGGYIDDAQKMDRIVWIQSRRQITDHVLDFSPFVKTETSDNPILHVVST